MNVNCFICGKKRLEKNVTGINKKLLGKNVKNFLCLDCLAEQLGCSVQDLLDKIEEFKEEGCVLFE